MAGSAALSVLVVDDEGPPREELEFLLARDDRVAEVRQAGSGAEALRLLEQGFIDAVFLDIAMPGLSGLDIAKVLSHFKNPPAVVFVTAHDEYAVTAFEINAVDYLLKPVREDRVTEAVRRIVEGTSHLSEPSMEDLTIPVELGGVTSFVQRSEVRYVESQGDYARLHTATGSHLVRVPIAVLQERWRDAGFVRIHRQCLVSLRHVTQLRQDGGHCAVVVDGRELVVSRRHTRELRDVLVRRAKPGAAS
jgi:DNA-binding LytR/AlgR family response regulator